MVANSNWVFLVYQLPREPSTPRIAVWRHLRRIGVAQLAAGLVAVPYDASTKEQIEWVAHRVLEAGGTASIWITTPTVQRFGRTLIESLATDRALEYSAITGEVETVKEGEIGSRRRALRRLRAELRRVERRDYFPPPERDLARRAVAALAETLKFETAQ